MHLESDTPVWIRAQQKDIYGTKDSGLKEQDREREEEWKNEEKMV